MRSREGLQAVPELAQARVQAGVPVSKQDRGARVLRHTIWLVGPVRSRPVPIELTRADMARLELNAHG